MTRLLDAQTCGSLVVLGAFGASEASAWFLEAKPASPLAWYLHLEVFHAFQAARRPESPLHLLFGPHALTIYVALLVLVLAARFVRFRFAVALFCNLAFLATVMLAYACLRDRSQSAQASLVMVGFDRTIDGFLVGLLTMSFLAFALSHIGFALAIFRKSEAPSVLDRRME